MSRATRGGSSRTTSVFSVITPWYDVSIHGLCLFTVETESMRCQLNTCATRCNRTVSLNMLRYKSSISFHLKNCPQMNNLTFHMHTQTNTVHCSKKTCTFYSVMLLQPQFLQEFLILLISPTASFLSFVLFFLQTFPAGFKAQCHA